MKALSRQNKPLKQLLLLWLSLSIAVTTTPLLPLGATPQTRPSTPPHNPHPSNSGAKPSSGFQGLMDLEQGLEFDEKSMRHVAAFDKLSEAIANKNRNAISKELIDPNHLIGQMLSLPDGGAFRLDLPEQTPPAVKAEEIETRISGNNLFIEGKMAGLTVGTHIIPNIKPIRVIEDKELIVVIDGEGDIYALPVPLVIQQAFNAPIPMIKVYDAKAADPIFLGSKNVKGTFLTRGLKPFTKEEVKRVSKTNSPAIIPRDMNNKILFNAGDLVVYDENANGSRTLLAIFNRNSIYQLVRRATIALASTAMLASMRGYDETIVEKYERLMEGSSSEETKTLEDSILEFTKDKVDQAEADNLRNKLLEHRDPVARLIFQAFSRDKLHAMVKQVRNLKTAQENGTKNTDQFSLKEWFNSYTAAERLAQIEHDAIDDIMPQLKRKVSIIHHRNVQENIARGLKEKDFRQDYVDHHGNQASLYRTLNRAATNNEEHPFIQQEDPWYKLLARHRLVYFTGRLAKWGGVGTVAGLGAYHFSPVEFNIVLNFFQDLMPDVLKSTYDGVPYWKPALYGGMAIMSFIPIVWGLGAASVSIMRRAADVFYSLSDSHKWVRSKVSLYDKFLDLLGRGEKKFRANNTLYDHWVPQSRGSYFKRIAKAFRLAADKYEPLDSWQRVVTFSMRPYAYMIQPYWNLVYKMINQPVTETMRTAISPFKKITADSPIGQQIGLSPGESFRVGLSPLNTTLKKQKKLTERQAIARKLLQQQNNRSRILAWTLGSFAVSKEYGVDLSTLLSIQTDWLSASDFVNISEDPQAFETWKAVAIELHQKYKKIFKNRQDIDINNVNPEDIDMFYNMARKSVQKLKKEMDDLNTADQKRSHFFKVKFRQNLRKLRSLFNNLGEDTLISIGEYTQSDFEFLRTVTASRFVAKQTHQSFISTHTTQALVPMGIGARADLNNPEALAHHPDAFSEDSFLWTSKDHLTDITNTFILSFMDGPKRALVFQTLKDKKETNYLPIERSVLGASPRPETFFRGVVHWFYGALNPSTSNLGGYYIKGLAKRFNTLFAGFSLTVAMRMLIAGQSPTHAFMAYMFTWHAGTLYYGWPWTIVTRGNQYEEERIADQKQSFESIVEQLSLASKRGDLKTAKEAYRKLVHLFLGSNKGFGNTKALARMEKNLYPMENWAGLDPNDRLSKAEIQDALKNTKKAPVVVALLADLNQAWKNNDYKHWMDTYKKLDEALEELINSEGFKTLEKKIEKWTFASVGNEALQNPPVFTAFNPHVSRNSTFFGGSVLTTYLGLNLLVAAFQPAKLVWSNVLFWAQANVAFHAVAFGLLSRYSYKNFIKPSAQKARATIAPVVHKTQRTLGLERKRINEDDKKKGTLQLSENEIKAMIKNAKKISTVIDLLKDLYAAHKVKNDEQTQTFSKELSLAMAEMIHIEKTPVIKLLLTKLAKAYGEGNYDWGRKIYKKIDVILAELLDSKSFKTSLRKENQEKKQEIPKESSCEKALKPSKKTS